MWAGTTPSSYEQTNSRYTSRTIHPETLMDKIEDSTCPACTLSITQSPHTQILGQGTSGHLPPIYRKAKETKCTYTSALSRPYNTHADV